MITCLKHFHFLPNICDSKSMLFRESTVIAGCFFQGREGTLSLTESSLIPGSVRRGTTTDDFDTFFFPDKTTPTSQHCLVTEGSSECYGSKIISGEKLKKSFCTVVRITDHENISTFRWFDLQRHTLSTSVFLDLIPQVWWGFFWYTRWLRLQSIQRWARHTLKMKHMT